MATYRAEWHGMNKVLNWLQRLVHDASNIAVEGVGEAALRVQDEQRRHLDAMIYDQPPRGDYVRTRTLYRSTHAAAPSATHSGDQGRARAGTDLAASDARLVAEQAGGTVESEIGSWIEYAEYVHRGVNQPQPRPFVAASVDFAGHALEGEMRRAVEKKLATVPRLGLF